MLFAAWLVKSYFKPHKIKTERSLSCGGHWIWRKRYRAKMLRQN